MPHPHWVQNHPSLRRMEHLLHQPYLWHLNRHSAARGIACGTFWAFIPVPAQTLLSCLCAIRMRGNVALALVVSWVAFFVLFPCYYLSYRIGLLILREKPMEGFFDNFHISLKWFWAHRGPILPLFVGSFPVAAVLAMFAYFGTGILWKWMLIRRIHRRNHRLRNEREAVAV